LQLKFVFIGKSRRIVTRNPRFVAPVIDSHGGNSFQEMQE